MSSSFTLATLKSTLQAMVEDTDTDLSDQLDTLIKLGEDTVLRDLPLAIFDTRGDVTITQGSQTATKPTGALVTHELYYLSGTTRLFLHKRSEGFCKAFANTTTEATPKYFADDYSDTAYFIAPEPNLSVTAEAMFTKRPNSLVTDTAGTWLSNNVGDLLLHASLMMVEKFNLADERVPLWREEYARLLASARLDFRHLLRGES